MSRIDGLPKSLEDGVFQLLSLRRQMARLFEDMDGAVEHILSLSDAAGLDIAQSASSPRVAPNTHNASLQYVSWRYEGQPKEEQFTESQTERFLEEQSFRVLIHEPWFRILYQKNGEMESTPFSKAGWAACGMLWLILMHVGYPIRFDFEACEVFDLPATRKARAKRMYGYKNKLVDALGQELVSSMIDRHRDWRYQVKEEDWSSCWIRPVAAPYQSELLRGIPGCPLLKA